MGNLTPFRNWLPRLENEHKNVHKNITTLEDKKDHLKKELHRLKQEEANLEAEAQLEEERLKTRKRLFMEIRETYEKARRNMNAGETRAAGLNHETEYLNKALEQISNSRSRLENDLAETSARSESILKTSKTKTRVREALMDKLQELEKPYRGNRKQDKKVGKNQKAC